MFFSNINQIWKCTCPTWKRWIWMAPFMSALRMAMTSTRACNMNSLPTNRMRSLLAIWLEMASGSRNWDGFLIGNGWLTGKTWEKNDLFPVFTTQSDPFNASAILGGPAWKSPKALAKPWPPGKFGRPLERENAWFRGWFVSNPTLFEYTTDLPNLIIWPKVWKTSATLMIWLVLRTWWQVLAFHVGLLKLSIASM